jgi:hypothetical protein
MVPRPATRRCVRPSSSPAAAPSSDVPAAPTYDTAAVTQGTTGINHHVIEIEDTVVVGHKRKHKSAVWSEFKEVTVNGQVKAECNWCHKKLATGSRSGTNHVRSHLEICESKQVRKGLKQSTLKLGQNTDGTVVIEKYVFDQSVARKELCIDDMCL